MSALGSGDRSRGGLLFAAPSQIATTMCCRHTHYFRRNASKSKQNSVSPGSCPLTNREAAPGFERMSGESGGEDAKTRVDISIRSIDL